jgi:hypothetical protein
VSTAHLTVLRAWRGGNKDGEAGWIVQFRFDAAGVQRLKNLIPPEGRQWDDTAKAWWFADDYLAEACRVAPGLEHYTAQTPLL